MLLNTLLLSMSISSGCCSSGASWTTRISVAPEADEEEDPQATEISIAPRASAPRTIELCDISPAPNGIHFDNRVTRNSSVCKHKGLLGFWDIDAQFSCGVDRGIDLAVFGCEQGKVRGPIADLGGSFVCRGVRWALESKVRHFSDLFRMYPVRLSDAKNGYLSRVVRSSDEGTPGLDCKGEPDF